MKYISLLLLACLLLPLATAAALVPRLSFLQNDEIKVGVDLSLGGALTWLSGKDGVNRVNNYDHGRQIQLSYFSGPVPFESGGQKPAEHWRHIGWNPIQAGDDFHHGSKTVDHRNDGREIYVKCVPLQWPLNNVPGECTMESWLHLDGHVLKARARFVNARSDRTQYPARLQELPALYANAAFHRVVSYTGARPFQDEATQLMPKSETKHPWTFWMGTEHWAALLDDHDQGLGLITPGRVWFTGGFAGKPGSHDTHAVDTGYLAGQALDILDHDIVHEFRYEVVVGSLEQIRQRATTHAAKAPPAWVFSQDRQGWHYQNARDQGWPVSGMLTITPTGHDPQMISPPRLWNASDAPILEIEAEFQTGEDSATIYWRKHGESAPRSGDQITFPVRRDGGFHRYQIRLADHPGYQGPMLQLRLDPMTGKSPESVVRVRSIRLVRTDP